MTFFQTRVPLSLNIVNIMQPYQFGKYKTNTSTCYNNNITLGLDHKLFKKTMGILSCYNPSLHNYIHIIHTQSFHAPALASSFLLHPWTGSRSPRLPRLVYHLSSSCLNPGQSSSFLPGLAQESRM